MPKYLVTCSVEHASGWQVFSVVADSEEEALRKFKAGDCEFEEDEVEVTALGEPEIELEDSDA